MMLRTPFCMKLSGQVTIITGASDGIGAACARALRERGATVVLTGRSAEKLSRVAAPGELSMTGDILDESFRTGLIEQTIARHGRIDILINNAGAGAYLPTLEIPMETARGLFDLNFFAPLDLARKAAVYMKQRRSGLIVNVSSIGGKIPLPWFTIYSSTKFALSALTHGLHMELSDDGIRTMLVCPGYVNTGFQAHAIAGRPPDLLGFARKWAISPEECAAAMVRGIERDAREVVTPGTGRFLIALERLAPSFIHDRIARHYRGGPRR